jgi:hypothetical protein
MIVHPVDERREKEDGMVVERNSGECCSDRNRNDSLDLDGTAFHNRDLGTSCCDNGAETVAVAADFLDNETRGDSMHCIFQCGVPCEAPTLVVHERSWAAPSSEVHHRDDNFRKVNGQAQEDRFELPDLVKLVGFRRDVREDSMEELVFDQEVGSHTLRLQSKAGQYYCRVHCFVLLCASENH